MFKSKRDPLGKEPHQSRAKSRDCLGFSIAGWLDLLESLETAPGGEALRLSLISLFATILALPALAQDGRTPPDASSEPAEAAVPVSASEAPPGRVGRLSFVSGIVNVRGSGKWEDALLNFPLAAEAAVRSGAKSRAEIEIGADTIDLAPDSEIEISKLDDLAIRVAVVRGRIGFAVRRLADGESVEVAFSHEALQPLQPAHYDIDAGTRRIAAWAGGTPSPGSDPSDAVMQLAAPDDFVEWCRSRDYDEERLAAPYYVSPHMTGVAELDAAGSWESTAEYGTVWVPSGLPADWAPYRDGHWHWITPWGWTWIDNEPWGFAPSHYGRWALVGERWVWVPGSFVAHPEYLPAVVAFLGTAGVGLSVADRTGPGIGWFPLAPGEAYWPSYSRSLAYIRSLNQGAVSDLETIQLDADDEPPLEVVDGHFANRGFASVVPRPVFVNGSAVAQALLTLPEQRLQEAPVLMGSPQVGPAVHQVAVAAPMMARPSRAQWVNHIAALVVRNASRAKALLIAFGHLHARESVVHLRSAHLGAPAYAQSTPPRHVILLRVAHAAPPPPHGGGGKGSRQLTARHRT